MPVVNTVPKDNPGVIAFPPVILVATLVLGAMAHWVWPIRLFDAVPARVVGGIIVGLAGVFAFWARSAMIKVGTNIRPDQPALALANSGPYVYTRNPMYLSLCALQVGIGLLIDGLLPVLFVVPLALVLHFGVVKREERYLTAKFGESYVSYTRRVRRWI